jgi:hypothetical protein
MTTMTTEADVLGTTSMSNDTDALHRHIVGKVYEHINGTWKPSGEREARLLVPIS